MNNVKIRLPLNTFHVIDFDLIELYIKVIEKKLVRKVRNEIDKKLDAMNQSISLE